MKMKIFSPGLLLCSQLSGKVRLVSSQNTTETLFEGDIIADYDTMKTVYDKETVSKIMGEEGIINEESPDIFRGASPTFSIWNKRMNANDRFVVRAYIDPSYSSIQYTMIRKSLRKLASKTGVLHFKILREKPTNGQPFLNYGFHSGTGCSSYIGLNRLSFTSEGQPITLSSNCFTIGIIQHETMHALGKLKICPQNTHFL